MIIQQTNRVRVPKTIPYPITAPERDLATEFYNIERALERLVDPKTVLERDSTGRAVLIINIHKVIDASRKLFRDWIGKYIPMYYQTGSDDVIRGLEKLELSSGIVTSWGQLHDGAVETISRETTEYFERAVTMAESSAIAQVEGVRESEIQAKMVARVQASPYDRETEKQKIIDSMKSAGIIATVGITGRKWRLDHYASMLTRTKAMDAYRLGRVNRTLDNGIDLFQVSAHLTSCENCRPAEGKVYTITGQTPGFPTLDSLQAMAPHLYAPNCRHVGMPFVVDLVNKKEVIEVTRFSNKRKPINEKQLEGLGFKLYNDPFVAKMLRGIPGGG
jgi:hypothetical protein